MSRLQFLDTDEKVLDQPAGLPINFGARAYDPGHGNDADGKPIGHSGLVDACSGDWSWKPHRYDSAQRYRFMVTGPRCTCTLSQPVGTSCARHTN
jgi:hypothetical protein